MSASVAPAIFSYGPRVLCAPGAAARLAEVVAPGSVLFVTDATVLKLGLADAAIEGLRADGRDVAVFAEVEPDPSRETVETAAALGREARAASVVGFGGGSPMDVAKVAAYLIGSGEPLDDIWGVGKTTGTGLPLILVPTTAGTGSEATPVAVVTVGSTDKLGISSPALIAQLAVLDPLLTLGLPRGVTAATGIDAIVHAIEAYTSAHLKNPMSDLMAREAIRLLAANLRRVCTVPDDVEARTQMLMGAHLAGVAFANAPVAGVHALAYPLGTRFHIAHGVSNALMLPHVLRFNLPAAERHYAEIAHLLDPALAGDAAALIAALERLAAEVGLPARLSEVGIEAHDIATLTEDAMRQERLLRNNPRSIAAADARALYEAAL